MDVTYPPEMLPAPDEGEEAEILVEHPDTRELSVVVVIVAPPCRPESISGSAIA